MPRSSVPDVTSATTGNPRPRGWHKRSRCVPPVRRPRAARGTSRPRPRSPGGRGWRGPGVAPGGQVRTSVPLSRSRAVPHHRVHHGHRRGPVGWSPIGRPVDHRRGQAVREQDVAEQVAVDDLVRSGGSGAGRRAGPSSTGGFLPAGRGRRRERGLSPYAQGSVLVSRKLGRGRCGDRLVECGSRCGRRRRRGAGRVGPGPRGPPPSRRRASHRSPRGSAGRSGNGVSRAACQHLAAPADLVVALGRLDDDVAGAPGAALAAGQPYGIAGRAECAQYLLRRTLIFHGVIQPRRTDLGGPIA